MAAPKSTIDHVFILEIKYNVICLFCINANILAQALNARTVNVEYSGVSTQIKQTSKGFSEKHYESVYHDRM